ncbi:MAG: hypothetical protein Q7K44_00495 [Candidatus Liptonbacteria bacterium]|nr:hypothetical protein [Candidatus Liptonbacteria bacterium]
MLDFIKKLRDGDETTKRRWLILFSGIAAVLVLFVWLKYFDSIIAGQTNNQEMAGQQAEQGAGQSFSFWQTFKAGLEAVFQGISDGFHSIFNAIREPKNYIIKS